LGHIRNYDEPIEDYLARRKKMEDGEYKGMPGVSLGVALRMELQPIANLPTPTVSDIYTAELASTQQSEGSMHSVSLAQAVIRPDLMPTPTTRDHKDGQAEHIREGVVQTDTVSRAIFNSGEINDISWGKFEPAIRRWEATLGRVAPVPTKPDGKDGSHRLNSEFTEWMMGVPEGWITDAGLTRNDELKACGNGVVPQQAEMAWRILLQGVEF